MSIIQGTSKTSAAAAHEISQSVRFNDNDSAYLEKTFASAGDRQIWTWSAWIKLSGSTARQIIFGAATGPSYISINENATGSAFFNLYNAGWYWETAAKYRDPSAWYHLVWAFDTTNATADSRMRFYVNGSEVTDYSTKHTTGSQNASGGINNNVVHRIGRHPASTNYYDGYLAEINFVDGQQLAPTDFGETNADTGQWVPKAYTNAAGYGTNGFYITGADSADLGADDSGNGNDFTSSGLTAADQVTDSPTDNYGVMNPLDNGRPSNITLSDGNLTAAFAGSGYNGGIRSSIFFDSEDSNGWYAECTLDSLAIASVFRAGVANASLDLSTTDAQTSADGWAYSDQGAKLNNSYTTGYGSSVGVGDVVGIAVRNGKIYFAVNNTWQGSADPVTESNPAFSNLTGDVAFCQSTNTGGSYAHTATWNFGQTGFTYTPPTGYKSLLVQDLPDPTIADPSAYFQTTLYTGDGSSSNEINQTGNSTFEPTMVWIKSRSAATDHVIQDQVRGNFIVYPNQSSAEGATGGGWVSSFDNDGFTVNVNGPINASGETFVGWQWKAGSSSVSNTDGDITSTVRADSTSGVSVLTYSGNGSDNQTIGHGLGIAPKMILTKRRDSSGNWTTYHDAVGINQVFYLNSTAAPSSNTEQYRATPTSSVYTVGVGGDINNSSGTYVSYVFAEVENFSKIDSFTGNGSAGGPFVYTGFKPSWLMIKRTSGGTGNWDIFDNQRDPFNVVDAVLDADSGSAEATYSTIKIDFLSNGFKVRGTQSNINNSGDTYIYMAFGDSFKTATAR